MEAGAAKSAMDLNLGLNSVSIKVIRARATHLQGDLVEGKGGADGEENDDEEGYFEATVAEPQEGGASKSSMDLNLVDKFQKKY